VVAGVSHETAVKGSEESRSSLIEQAAPEQRAVLFDWLVFFLCCGATYALLPLWAPLMLAAWTAILAAPLVNRASSLHRKRRAAAITTAVAAAILLPLGTVILFLSSSLLELIHRVAAAPEQGLALRNVLATNVGIPSSIDANGIMTAIKEYGAGALRILGATAEAAIGVTIFILATYTFLMSGKALWMWLLDHLPFPRGSMHRLANAFVETGRGLFLGIGATALLQGTVAGVGYYFLGVPQAAILGLLTVLAALIPSFGTALVWIPVAIGLFLTGRPVAGIAMLCIGAVISTVDNFIRPALTRNGDLQLPTFLVFVAMLGGLAAFGGWGLVLGPLVVRLAVEGLEVTTAARVASSERIVS
jgi:predicted PurR-regulated permease PerM